MSGNASNFLVGVPIFNFSSVQFGPATLALMNQTNSFTSPSSSLLSIMTNTNWPVYVVNSSAIVFQLTAPYVGFDNLLTNPELCLYDPAYIMANGGPGTPSSPNPYFITNFPPGTGPYEITSAAVNSNYIFAKDPTYWGDSLTPAQIATDPTLDPGHFQNIVIYYVPDPTVSYIDLTTGRVQMADITGDNFRILLDENSSNYNWVKFTPKDDAELVFFSMNTQLYPTNITDVRLAIVHAVNVSQIIQQAVFGYGEQYFGPEAPIYGSLYNPLNYSGYAYNLTEAANYLTSAGFPNGKGLPDLNLVIDGSYPWEETSAELIQTDLANIGITLNINDVTHDYYDSYYYGTTYSQWLANPPPDQLTMIGGTGYAPDYIGPADYVGNFITNESLLANSAVYNSNASYATFEALLSSSNVTQQVQLMSAAEQQVYNQAPYDWLFLANLILVDGSYVYNTQVVHNYYLEANLGGEDTLPLINTIS
jgi:peptide/nickel transport system substrate-binding protein